MATQLKTEARGKTQSKNRPRQGLRRLREENSPADAGEGLRLALRQALWQALLPELDVVKGTKRSASANPQHYPRAGWRRIGEEVMHLHRAYTERDESFAQEGNPIHSHTRGYQAYFLPRNWFRVYSVLTELPWSPGDALPVQWLSGTQDAPVLRILDLGCGSGAFGLAWLAWLAGRKLPKSPPLSVHLTLVDQGRRLLALAERNVRTFAAAVLPGVSLRVEARADGVERFLSDGVRAEPYAVAGAAMMLNELGLLGPRRASDRGVALAKAFERLTRPGGVVLLVEAGTRRGYMNLMALREPLMEGAGHSVLYPCAHEQPCPMWEPRVRNWCHGKRNLPQKFCFDAELRGAGQVALEMRSLNLAALAVQTCDATQIRGAEEGLRRIVAPFERKAGERIVSAPLNPRGPEAGDGKVLLACAPDGQLHELPAPPGWRELRGHWWQPREEG